MWFFHRTLNFPGIRIFQIQIKWDPPVSTADVSTKRKSWTFGYTGFSKGLVRMPQTQTLQVHPRAPQVPTWMKGVNFGEKCRIWNSTLGWGDQVSCCSPWVDNWAAAFFGERRTGSAFHAQGNSYWHDNCSQCTRQTYLLFCTCNYGITVSSIWSDNYYYIQAYR